MPSTDQIPGALAVAFTNCSAEAQMLEHAIKIAISKDIHAFAKANDQTSFLEMLEKITLGHAKNIAMGTSPKKEIVACVGFIEFVKMQWGFFNRKESELSGVFTDAVERRNRLAHRLLAEVICSALSVSDALAFLKDSEDRLFELRQLITVADGLSSRTGSVAADGSSLPRFKRTS